MENKQTLPLSPRPVVTPARRAGPWPCSKTNQPTYGIRGLALTTQNWPSSVWQLPNTRKSVTRGSHNRALHIQPSRLPRERVLLWLRNCFPCAQSSARVLGAVAVVQGPHGSITLPQPHTCGKC